MLAPSASVGSDPEQGLCGNVEQQLIGHGLVLTGDLGDRRRQREDHVVVLDWQQIGLARLKPASCGAAWHLGQCRLRHEL
jgi:hypothetical protein